MINAKDVLELGKKREITSESSSGGDGGGNVAKQSSLDDDHANQTSRMPMSHDHSISSANPSSMDIESSGSSSAAIDVKRSVTTPIQYTSVEVVDMQVSGSEGGTSGGSGVSSETDIHQSNMQQMAAGVVHLENQNGSDQIVSMEQQQQQQHLAHDHNNQAMLNQDGSHSVAPPHSAQGLVVHSSDGQSIATHNDQNVVSSGMTASQSLISPNEQFRAQELSSKNSFPMMTFFFSTQYFIHG